MDLAHPPGLKKLLASQLVSPECLESYISNEFHLCIQTIKNFETLFQHLQKFPLFLRFDDENSFVVFVLKFEME